MNYNDTILDIVAHIYESIAYDDVWEEVLNQIAALIRAHSGNLFVLDRQTQHISLINAALDRDSIAHYIETLAHYDAPRKALEDSTTGAIRLGSELHTDHLPGASEAYDRFAAQHQWDQAIGACFYRDSQFIACIQFHRSQAEERFDNKTKKTLGILVPHLSRAFGISVQTKLAQLQTQVQSQVESLTDTALYLVQDKGITRPMNAKAEEIARANLVLSLSNERLQFRHALTHKRMQHLIQRCILAAQGKEAFPGGFVRQESFEVHNQEWHMAVSPYRNTSHNHHMWKAKGALVIVRPVAPGSFHRLNTVLSDFYGLTASETEVLIKTVSGLSSSEIADELSLTRECVRSRLKKIYQKTGVSNQVQLTHNILEGPYKLANMLG